MPPPQGRQTTPALREGGNPYKPPLVMSFQGTPKLIPHWLSGWPKKYPHFIFTTRMVFPKSLKFMSSGSEIPPFPTYIGPTLAWGVSSLRRTEAANESPTSPALSALAKAQRTIASSSKDVSARRALLGLGRDHRCLLGQIDGPGR